MLKEFRCRRRQFQDVHWPAPNQSIRSLPFRRFNSHQSWLLISGEEQFLSKDGNTDKKVALNINDTSTSKRHQLVKTVQPQDKENKMKVVFLNRSSTSHYFKKWTDPGLFFDNFRSFQTQILQKKTVGFRGISTLIVGVGRQAC